MRISFAWILLMAPALLSPSIGYGKDYAPTSTGWDGMSALAETAREARVRLEYNHQLDWAEVSTDEILIFLYPEESIDEEQAETFIRHGGHVVIADDHGASDHFLARVGIHRLTGFAGHDEFLYDDENFPVLTPVRRHFLFFNLREAGGSVIGNYPSAFQVDPGVDAILTYANSEQVFIAEATIGDGAVLAVADASLFINEMQRHHGDKQLVANLMRYYCRREPCKVRVILPHAEQQGVFTPPIEEPPDSLTTVFLRSVEMINGVISTFRTYVSQGTGLRIFWILLSLLLVVGTGFFFMIRGEMRPTRWEGVRRMIPSLDEQRAAGILGAWQHAEFAEPLRHLMGILESVIGVGDREAYGTEGQRKELAANFVRRYGQPDPGSDSELEGAVIRVLRFSHAVGGTHSTGAASTRAVTGEEFLEAVADARPILDAVDQRRSWSRPFRF